MTCMEKPAEPFSLVLATVVSLLLSPSCGFSPVSPLTQCGFHTSLPTRDQRGMMGTISHGHGAANHWIVVTQMGQQMPCKIPTSGSCLCCVSDSLMMPSLHYLTKRLLCKTNKSKLLSQLCCTAGFMSRKQPQARHCVQRQLLAACLRSGKIRHEQWK